MSTNWTAADLAETRRGVDAALRSPAPDLVALTPADFPFRGLRRGWPSCRDRSCTAAASACCAAGRVERYDAWSRAAVPRHRRTSGRGPVAERQGPRARSRRQPRRRLHRPDHPRLPDLRRAALPHRRRRRRRRCCASGRPSAGGLSRIAQLDHRVERDRASPADLARRAAGSRSTSRAPARSAPARSARLPRRRCSSPCGGRMIAVFIMSAIEKAQAFDDVPRLTAAQTEALALVQRAGRRPADPPRHGLPPRRHAVPVQPLDPALAHRLRGLARAASRGATCCGCGSPRRRPGAAAEVLHATSRARTASGRPDGIRVPGVPLSRRCNPNKETSPMNIDDRAIPCGSPSAWRGAEVAQRDDWILRLNESDNRELRAALAPCPVARAAIPRPGRAGLPAADAGAGAARRCPTRWSTAAASR